MEETRESREAKLQAMKNMKKGLLAKEYRLSQALIEKTEKEDVPVHN